MSDLFAVKVGGRISHTPVFTASASQASLGAALGGAIVGPAGLGGVASAAFGRGVGAGAGGVSLADLLPAAVHGVVGAGALSVSFGAGAVPVPLGTPVVCTVHASLGPQPLAQGAATVFLDGVPLARVSDTLPCGAVLCDGLGRVSVGGPRHAATGSSSGSAPSLAGPLGGVTLGARLSKLGSVDLATHLGGALASWGGATAAALGAAARAVASQAAAAVESAGALAEGGLHGAKAALGGVLGAKLR